METPKVVMDEVETIIAEQDAYVRKHSAEWGQHRAAFLDDFWRTKDRGKFIAGGRLAVASDMATGAGILHETNRIRPWVDSYRDGLFYKGMRSLVRPPLVPRGSLEDVLGPQKPAEADDVERPASPAEQVSRLIDYWVGLGEVEAAAEQAVDLALLFPECALKLGNDSMKDMHNPIDGVWLQAIPPWEAVYDRDARTLREMRYTGHMWPCPVGELLERFPKLENAKLPRRSKSAPLDGDLGKSESKSDSDVVRILELYLSDDALVVQNDDGTSSTVPGRMLVIMVDAGKEDENRVLADEAMPYSDADENPLHNIVPIVLLNQPEARLRGSAPVKGVYGQNAELNVMQTIHIQAARRDATRVGLRMKDTVDDVTMAKVMDAGDMEFVEVDDPGGEGQGRLGSLFHMLETPPVAKSIHDTMQMLEINYQQSAGMSPMSRGQALKYATAAEVHSHNDYSETTLGRLRKRLDKAMLEVFRVFLRVLHAGMEAANRESIDLLVDNSMVSLKRSSLDEQWSITFADAAATPLADAQRRMELIQAHPLLTEAWERAATGDPFGKAMLRHIVDLYDLPPDFHPDELLRALPPPPEPEPAPPPAPPLPGDPVAPAPNDPGVDALTSALEEAT